MPTAQFWWYVRKKSLLKINLPDYVREKLTVAVSLLVSARTVQERAYFFSETGLESGRCYKSWLPNREKRWPAKRPRRRGMRSGEKDHEKRRESVGA
jgi:hypothetical protein